jgi:dipeptidyl aminopeptidase/acylaminoacyl peptidase
MSTPLRSDTLARLRSGGALSWALIARLALCGALAAAACAPPGTPPPVAPAPPAPQPSASVEAIPPATPPASVEDVEEAASGYDRPPKELLDVMLAPSPPAPNVSPTGEHILLVSWEDYPPMSRVGTPFLRLAGVRVEPRNRAKHDTPGGYGIRPCARELRIVKVAGGGETRVSVPKGACPGAPIWSADGARFAFQNVLTDTVELWVGDARTGEARAVSGVRLNPMLESAVQWLADQKHLLVKLVPRDQGPPPRAPRVPPGPRIQETAGEKGESSTYETRDTLSSKYDEALFDYYGASQLAVVDVQSGEVKSVGKPGLYADVSAAPSGDHVLVRTVKRPYSYVTTHDRFAHDVEVWGLSSGDTKVLASLPLADRVPVHGVPTGPRNFSWRSSEPSTLVWAEALDGGDWKAKVPARDKVMMQKSPFTRPAVEITRTEQRFNRFTWSASPGVAFLDEYDHNRHWKRVFQIDIDDAKSKPALLWDLSTEEKYRDPGHLDMHMLPNGAWVVSQDGDSVYLAGVGSSPEGDRPFLDRFDLKTRKTERLFRSDRKDFERFLDFGGKQGGGLTLITWHQSPTEPPNAFLRTLDRPVQGPAEGEPAFTSSRTAITHMADPAPRVRAIQKRLVTYKRKDGTALSFTLYTPPDYKEGTRVPTILYAYPRDYADAKKAAQVSGSERTFTRLRHYKLLLLAGYAIIDNASFPIVGDPRKAYDTYLEQLVDNAKAAVDKAVELGVADPDRIGVTGHSHGALMTANLLAHTDLFRAGVATSGSYNKTLTPFGFQNERRSVWEAQGVYLKASPFFFADKLKLPLLIMHGDDDANPGTTPLQARKLFEAIRGNGGTARLVMLPGEPHWYTALESNEQYLSEMVRWFDRHVKNAPSRVKSPGKKKK